MEGRTSAATELSSYVEGIPKHDCGRNYKIVEGIWGQLRGFGFCVPLYYCSECRVYSWANRQRKTREEIDKVIKKHKDKLEELTDFIQV